MADNPLSNEAIANIVQALDGEYAATYAYGIIGARASQADRPRARKALDEHRNSRDELRLILVNAGQPIPAPATAYQLPNPVDTPQQARELAGLIERRLVQSWAAVASSASGSDRTTAIRHARECATRAVSWGADSQAFPG